MSYRAGSEEFEEEEEEEEEEEKEEGSARSLAVAGEDGSKRQGGLGTGESGVSHESRRSSGSCDDGELSTSDQDGNSRGRSAGVDQESPVHHRSSNSDEVGGGGKACLSPPRHVSSGEFESDLDYNEEEDDQKKEKTVERRGKQRSDEGELSSNEEGEIKEKLHRDHRPRYRMRKSRSLSPVPHRRIDTSICRHYLAGTCDWGRSCRFRHPPADELIQLKEKGFLPPDHRPRRQEGREGWSNLRDIPSHRSTHPHDGTPFGMGPGFGPFPGRFSHGYPVGSDFGPQPYPQGSYSSGPYMDPGRPPFASGWMGYGQDSQGMQEESDGWIRLKMPVMSLPWDMDDTSPPRRKKKRRRDHSNESEQSEEEGKLKAKKKKKKTKKPKESDSEESSSSQKVERKRKKKQKQKEPEHNSNSDGCREDSVSKGKKKKAKQRKQQKEDSQERSTDSEKEKKSPREKSASLSGSAEVKKTSDKGKPERSTKEEEEDPGEAKDHKYKRIERELQIVNAAINRRNRHAH